MAAMEALVGRLVLVETTGGTSVTGRVAACDLAANVLVLERPAMRPAGPASPSIAGGHRAPVDLDWFNIAEVVAVNPVVDSMPASARAAAVTAPTEIPTEAVERREALRLRAAADALAKVGSNVSHEAQRTFNLLDRTYAQTQQE
jgi:hypothetical protein